MSFFFSFEIIFGQQKWRLWVYKSIFFFCVKIQDLTFFLNSLAMVKGTFRKISKRIATI
jgi:hypothetical protein